MSVCSVEVIKLLGKYLNTATGTVCYNTDRVLTTVLDKQNVEGFATIVMKLTSKSGLNMSREEMLLSYQWLEHLSMYANQAAVNPTFAKIFLEGINKTLEKNSYLTGQTMTIADIAAYHVLYTIIERLSIPDRESVLNVCRWSKNIQAQPRVCASRAPLPLNHLNLVVVAPATH